MKVILGSASPRREQLLKMIFDEFEIKVADIEEIVDERVSIEKAIEKIALQKAEAVCNDENSKSLIITADTSVVLNDTIYGKPKNKEDAFNMLKSLSGKKHKVITSVCIYKDKNYETFSHISKVEFFKLTDEEILEYISTNEPMDKAGAYGIQGKGSLLVKGIEGDYFSIMGLPISLLNQKLKKFI